MHRPGRAPRRGFTLAALGLGLTLLAAAPVSAVAWSTTSSLGLTGSNGLFYERDGLTASGDVVNALIWNEWSVVAVRSPDAGSSWSGAVTLGSGSGPTKFRPSGIASSGNRVIAVFARSVDDQDRTLLARVSTDGGASYGPAITIASYSNATHDMGNASVGVSGKRAVIAWTDRRNGRVYVRRSTNGGATWKPAVRIATTTAYFVSGKDGHVDVAMSGSKVYVAYDTSKTSSSHKGVAVRRSLDGGATWKPAVTITTKEVETTGAAVAASGNTVLVLFNEGTSSANYNAKVARSTDSGASFKTTLVQSKDDGYMGEDIALSGQKARLVTKVEFFGGGTHASRFSANGGRTWAAADDVGGALGEAATISISPSATTILLTIGDLADTVVTRGS